MKGSHVGLILLFLVFSGNSLAISIECNEFLSTAKGSAPLIKFNNIVKGWSTNKLTHNQELVKKILVKCKNKGNSPYYCLSNSVKKTNYCFLEKLNVLIVIEGVKRRRNVNNGVREPVTPHVIERNEVGLGKLLLKSNFSQVNQSYLAYYDKGPNKKISEGVFTYGGFHPGVDYRASKFTRVHSPVNGRIQSVDGLEWGRLTIKTDDGKHFILLHMSEFAKTSGVVKKGDYLGKTGDVGSPGDPHLHVEYRTARSGAAFYFGGAKGTPKSEISTGFNINPVLVIN